MPGRPGNKTAVALSGGIDSLVSAFLLKQKGVDIFGLHFITGHESGSGRIDPQHRITHLARLLDIKIHALEIHENFENHVINYFISTYASGRTPNPCMVCNREIKFGIMLDYARSLGADRLATGHYARTQYLGGDRYGLTKGIDPQKDQSYFLAMLTPVQLASACFILGDKTKNEVRQIAKNNDLEPFYKYESQDICFIREGSCQDFLHSRLDRGYESGDIVDSKGRLIGRHNGLFRYTIGQRRGINCPASEPYYVLEIDADQNRLIVGFRESLYKNRCRIYGVNWIHPKPGGPVDVETRIRYRHEAVESMITPEGCHGAVIEFKTPQPAVTPGQAAVCYQGDKVVAAGWIE